MDATVPLTTHLFLLAVPLAVSGAALLAYLRGGRRGR
jgi:hypothetical protein